MLIKKSEKESGRSTSIILILCFLDIQRNLDDGLPLNLAILYRKNQGLFSCQKFLKIMTVSRSAKNQIGVGWCASRLMFCITNWRYLFSNLLDSRDGYTLHESSPLDACQTISFAFQQTRAYNSKMWTNSTNGRKIDEKIYGLADEYFWQ